MRGKSKWAILILSAIVVSLVMVSSPVVGCWSQYTECEGETVHQGNGGATDYWYDDLYPPEHQIGAGETTEWIINVHGGWGCSDYEHCTVTDNTPPTDWITSIRMGTIHSGSFHYIEAGNPAVNEGDDIEGREFYIGRTWNYDIVYSITAPSDATGGESAEMTCTVYVVGYLPENQHDYVYVHCIATVVAENPPWATLTHPTGGETLAGSDTITWDAGDLDGDELSFSIYLSPDGGQTFPYTLATSLGSEIRSLNWDTTAYPDDIDYKIHIDVFDGGLWGYDDSDDFAIDNQPPDPPENLIIQFGLTTNSEPNSKGPEDDTGSTLEYLQNDDGVVYSVMKGKTLSIETFDTLTQNDPVESAMLYVEYWVESTEYDGTNSICWKLEGEGTWHGTGIYPINTETSPVVKTFDLFAEGVDTIDEIANLDIAFPNNDGGEGQSVMFDYIWVIFKASSNDIGLTWEPSSSPDIDHYHVYRSTDGVSYSLVRCTAGTSALSWNDAGKAVDANNYFYKIRGKDKAGNEGPATYIVGKYAMPLSNGWNMVSIPLALQGDNSLNAVLQSIDGNYKAVRAYDPFDINDHWKQYKKGKSFGNDLTEIDETMGLWILMTNEGTFMAVGKLPEPTTIQLKKGWNFIGYPNLDSELRDDALSSISGKYNGVFSFNPTTGIETVDSSDYLSPEEGYWIHTTEDCSLLM